MPRQAQHRNGIIAGRTPKEAVAQFADWASIFSGKLFAMIVAYADESGTHDRTGQQPGASTATIGGYIGLFDDWRKFDSEWKDVLTEYSVPAFHFKDWTEAQKTIKIGSSYVGKAGDYKGWKKRCLLEFMEELSEII